MGLIGRVILPMALVVSILAITYLGEAGDDRVYFFDDPSGDHEINFSLVGEDSLYLQIVFGNNCTNYSIEIETPLLKKKVTGINPDEYLEGRKGKAGLNLNPDAEPGIYEFIIYFNYTLMDGTPVNLEFPKSVEHINPIDILDVRLPSGQHREFEITFRTYVDMDSLTILFDGDGVEVETETINVPDPVAGEYTFSTKLVSSVGFEGQEVGYHIIGEYGNHMVERLEYNIPVNVDWTNATWIGLSISTWLIIIILIIILVVVALWLFRKQKKSDDISS